MEKGLYYYDGTKYIFVGDKKPLNNKDDTVRNENKELKKLINIIKSKVV